MWRRQWIDFRGWDVGRSDRALALPQVPDTVTQARLPAAVARVRHVLRAIAALPFTLGGALCARSGQGSEASLADLLALDTVAAAIGWALIAHRLARRTRPAPLLYRAGLVNCVVTAIVVGVDLHALANESLTGLHVAGATAFLAAARVWLSRQRRVLEFWLPDSKPARGALRTVLGTYRDWSTALWTTAYALLWMAVLGID